MAILARFAGVVESPWQAQLNSYTAEQVGVIPTRIELFSAQARFLIFSRLSRFNAHRNALPSSATISCATACRTFICNRLPTVSLQKNKPI